MAALAGAMATFLVPGGAGAANVFPSEDACHVRNNDTPTGDCGPFKQVFRDTFNNRTVAVGRFSDCNHSPDTPSAYCGGLTGADRTNWWAYPTGWDDTATSGADGNGGRTLGGVYHPEDTVSVIRQSNGDGQLRVRMYRPAAGGPVHSAAVVPRKCMALRYGKFTERLIVRTRTNGYKLAHLHYTPDEIDYPEAGGNFATDSVSAYTHGFTESNTTVAPASAWTAWHTYSQEIVPGRVRFYFDGKLVRTINGDYPRAGAWVLQNESALGGGYAAPGSSVVIDTTGVTCYRYQP
jgi:glycosyl hydrolase family 16